jgi:hypothetical protein
VSIVNEPIQDAVGDSGITDLIVPLSDRHLAGEDRGACRVAVVTDFQKVTALTVGQWSHGPIIDQEDVDAGNPVQQLAKAAVGAGDSQIAKQTGSADVKRCESFADRFLSQSLGDETLTDATGSSDDQVMVLANPVAGRQTADELAVEATGMTIVDVFDGGVAFEPRLFKTAAERLVLAPVSLLVHQ